MSRTKPKRNHSRIRFRKPPFDPRVLEAICIRRYVAFLRAVLGPQPRAAR